MTNQLPSYERCAKSPEIPSAFEGVIIELARIPDGPPNIVIHGAFQLPASEVEEMSVNPYRAVVVHLVDTAGFHPYCFSAAGRAIMLEPIDSPPGYYRGYFNVEAFEMAEIPRRAGTFFVSAYLNMRQAAPIAVTVNA